MFFNLIVFQTQSRSKYECKNEKMTTDYFRILEHVSLVKIIVFEFISWALSYKNICTADVSSQYFAEKPQYEQFITYEAIAKVLYRGHVWLRANINIETAPMRRQSMDAKTAAALDIFSNLSHTSLFVLKTKAEKA
jgi:hypothetical protein